MPILAAIDWADAVGDATSTILTDFTGALAVLIPVTFGIAGVIMVYRKVRGQVK